MLFYSLLVQHLEAVPEGGAEGFINAESGEYYRPSCQLLFGQTFAAHCNKEARCGGTLATGMDREAGS